MAYKGLVNDFCVFTGDNSYRVLFPNITYYVGSNNCNASPPLATATSNQQYFKQSCGPSIAHTFDDDNMPDFSFENGKVMTGSCKYPETFYIEPLINFALFDRS